MFKLSKVLVLGAVLAAAGCAEDGDTTSRPTISELEQGLTLLDQDDPTVGVSAAYRKGDNVVYLETKVGALKPKVYRELHPEDPENEIDVRFVDQNGVTFFVQRGGDGYVDPTWGRDINAAFNATVDPAARDLDFILAREAAGEFVRIAPVGFVAAKHHMADIAARPAPAEDPERIARSIELEAEAQNADSAYGTWSGSGSWWLEGDLYSGDVCALWICPGEHSAVGMWAWQTSWNLVINACNHGRCPGASGMGYRCYSNSGRWVSNPSLSGDTTAGSTTAQYGQGCRSDYNWNSGGANHLCNDDSAFQLWQIKNGGKPRVNAVGTNGSAQWFTYTGTGYGGDCGSGNDSASCTAYYACWCSDNNGCDNDWARPACP